MLLQNVRLTNIDTSDIAEINEARQILIDQFIKKANTKGSLLYNLIKQRYQDALDNGKNIYNKDTRYPDKISANNLITTFIDKDLVNQSKTSQSDSNLINATETREYEFLVTIPIYDLHQAGYEIQTFSFINKFNANTSWMEDNHGKAVSAKKKIYEFHNPQKIDIIYSDLKDSVDPN